AHCTHTVVTTCSLTPDGCCPTGCNANNDRDCSPVCGNGVVESGELCDTAIGPGLPGHCPVLAARDDRNPSTVDRLAASACQTQCPHTEATCSFAADGCCPTGCNANNDADCPAVCGNGFWEPGELCDTAIPAGSPGACPTSCPPSPQPCIVDNLQNAGTCQA